MAVYSNYSFLINEYLPYVDSEFLYTQVVITLLIGKLLMQFNYKSDAPHAFILSRSGHFNWSR